MMVDCDCPTCARCGYQYDPNHPEKGVVVMPSPKGFAVACFDCIEELGRCEDKAEKTRILRSMTVEVN